MGGRHPRSLFLDGGLFKCPAGCPVIKRLPRRVIVTGATGLIGRAVVRRLAAQNDHVIAIVRPGNALGLPSGVATAEIDLGERPGRTMTSLGPFDAVIHLAQAAGWHDFPKNAGQVATVSVSATAELAEAAVSAGAKVFVLASSGGIYGPSTTPIVETAPIKPAGELGFYLATKAAAEQLLRYFEMHLTVHILRPFFVYGPMQAPEFLVPRLIKAVRSGTPIRIDGGRGPRLNPIHVDDAAEAFVASLNLGHPLVANIAGSEVVSVRDIGDLAAARIGILAQYEIVDREPDDFVADITTMSTSLGRPKIELAVGLGEIIAG